MLQGGLCSTTVLHAAALRLTTCKSLELSESSCSAKNRGQVESARPLVEKLVAAGMFIGDEFVEAVLAGIGE